MLQDINSMIIKSEVYLFEWELVFMDILEEVRIINQSSGKQQLHRATKTRTKLNNNNKRKEKKERKAGRTKTDVRLEK